MLSSPLLCATAQAADHATAELGKTQKGKRLKGFEAVRGVILEPNTFTVSPLETLIRSRWCLTQPPSSARTFSTSGSFVGTSPCLGSLSTFEIEASVFILTLEWRFRWTMTS